MPRNATGASVRELAQRLGDVLGAGAVDVDVDLARGLNRRVPRR
jgi:hypothetical protein